MLQRVTIEGIELPRLYIAENNSDVKQAMESGIPFLKWNLGKDELIRQLLRPTLEKMFPYVKWDAVLGKHKKTRSKVTFVNRNDDLETDIDISNLNNEKSDDIITEQIQYDDKSYDRSNTQFEDTVISSGTRMISGSNNETFTTKMSIEDYVGDLSSSVNIDVLQELNMLPSFMGDIVDNIKINLSNNMRWKEGYTKKLCLPMGNFNGSKQLPNLIILDISHSIPKGIAATMLTLIDTMRSQLYADLIITSKRSVFYPYGCELPNPQTLRDYFGYGNERDEFFGILNSKIKGKEYGHVISFGDNDSCGVPNGSLLQNTKVHAVHHYHTTFNNTFTGYAKWAEECQPDEITYNTNWCNVIER